MKIRQAIKILNNTYGLLFRYKNNTVLKAEKVFQKKCKLKKWSDERVWKFLKAVMNAGLEGASYMTFLRCSITGR